MIDDITAQNYENALMALLEIMNLPGSYKPPAGIPREDESTWACVGVDSHKIATKFIENLTNKNINED